MMRLTLTAALLFAPHAGAVPTAGAWSRTKCGSPQGGAQNTDIITEWGKQITPESVKCARTSLAPASSPLPSGRRLCGCM